MHVDEILSGKNDLLTHRIALWNLSGYRKAVGDTARSGSARTVGIGLGDGDDFTDVYDDEVCDAEGASKGGDGGGSGASRAELSADDSNPTVRRGDDGVYSTDIDVPSLCVGKLIGKRGAAKQQLEVETGTKYVA